MFFQKMSVPVQSTVTVSSFLGLDRRARGELGSFREMENLCAQGYPTLTVRRPRGIAGSVTAPGGLTAKDGLIWVDGHTLYIGGVATELVLTEGSKQLIGMGNWLIVWPDKKYINTGDLSQHGSLENRVQTQGQVTLSLCGAKGAALGELCTYMGIPIENTVAIGDYFNDIELMRAAGHSVAMGNAPKEVQLAADTVTGRCLDGGVAEVLYGLIRKYG